MVKKILAILLSLATLSASGSVISAEENNVIYLSDIDYEDSSTTEYGQIQKDKSVESNPITLNVNGTKKTFAKGIGVNATAKIIYDVSSYTDSGYNYFETYVGVDNDVSTGSVTFIIQLDGKTVFQTGSMSPSTPAKLAQIGITGAKELVLIADKGSDNICDHADFANARISKDSNALKKLKSITVKTDKNWLEKGESVNINATGTQVDNKTIDLAKVTYTSDNTAVATVNKSGVITGVSDGIATITAGVTEDGNTTAKTVDIIVGEGNETSSWDVSSPDGKIKALFQLSDGKLNFITAYDNKAVVNKSDLGIVTSLGDFTSEISFKSKANQSIKQEYPMYSGKASVYKDNSNETTLTFTKDGVDFSLVIRVADDSLSFKYVIDNTTDFKITSENTTYSIPDNSDVISQPYNNHYENLFDMSKIEDLSGNKCLTFTYQTPDGISVLLSEANMGTNYCGSMLLPIGNNTVRYTFPVEQGTTPINVVGAFESPWRVAVIGDLATIAECETFENLSNPSVVSTTDDDWLIPGATTWTWLTNEGTNNPNVYKRYIDFTAEMGWNYVLMDEGWSVGNRSNVNLPTWIDDLVSYADEREIGLLAWLHYTAVDTPAEIENVLGMISRAGIKGVKIDFFDNENQWTMNLYDQLLKASNKYKLVVNLHGANKPTGERREFPFCLTREGIQGHEYYNVQAFQNCVLPLTRAVVGPSDYTPKLTGKNVTTNQMAALAVLLESGIPCFASSPEEYRSSALYSWYKDMPPVWDETKLLGADLGDYISMARRSGDNWYISSICVSGQDAKIDLSLLDKDTSYYATIYKDSDNKDISDIEIIKVTDEDTLTIPMSDAGGCNVKLTKSAPTDVKITLDKQTINMDIGKSETITATITGDTAGMPIVWKSNNKSVATVTGGVNAAINAVDVGNVKISAIIGTGSTAKTVSCNVFVDVAPYSLSENWDIKNEDNKLYSFDSETKVTVTTTTGDIYPPNSVYKNMILTDAGSKDFSVSTKLTFSPTNDFQSAGIMIYSSDDCFFSLQRRFHSNFGGNCIGGIIRTVTGAKESSITDTAVGKPIFLKVEKTGSELKGYFSEDGSNWTLVCSETNSSLDADNLKIGIYTGKGINLSSADIPAVFEDYKINNTVIPFAIKGETQYTLGDVNEDDLISVTDIVNLRAIIMGNAQASNTQFAAADINKDCELTVSDIVALRGIIMNSEVS